MGNDVYHHAKLRLKSADKSDAKSVSTSGVEVTECILNGCDHCATTLATHRSLVAESYVAHCSGQGSCEVHTFV